MDTIRRLMVKEGNFKRFSYKGFDCVINRANWGHLCGYVAISKLTPKYYQNYDNCYKLLGHGGLNWFNYGCSWWNIHNLRKKKRKKVLNKWYIGFDCGHYGELMPNFYDNSLRLLKNDNEKYNEYKLMIENGEFTCMLGGEYRDMTYVENEIKGIINQILI